MVIAIPDHWPTRLSPTGRRCDMIKGACACGATHSLDEDWVVKGIVEFGVLPAKTRDGGRYAMDQVAKDKTLTGSR